jgi:hypothetical protein
MGVCSSSGGMVVGILMLWAHLLKLVSITVP